jgi:Na+-translocating ferredoxin:NAD+ oxidoreductase subunit G
MAIDSSFKNMALTLLVITFVASAGVGVINEITKEPRAKAGLEKKAASLRAAIPEFDNDPLSEGYVVRLDEGELACYPGKKGGEPVGTAVETISRRGYGGAVRLLVGFLPDGSIYDTVVLEQKETPGLGDKMGKGKSNFALQFKGKDPSSFKLRVKKDGGDVDAITAATISSRAYCEALRLAYDNYRKGRP